MREATRALPQRTYVVIEFWLRLAAEIWVRVITVYDALHFVFNAENMQYSFRVLLGILL